MQEVAGRNGESKRNLLDKGVKAVTVQKEELVSF